MNERSTDISDFIGECGAGVLAEKLALALSNAALAQVTVAEKGKKAQVGLTFTFSAIGDNQQVMVDHKITTSIPTKRGKKAEEDTTSTPFHVLKGGKLSIDAPREEYDGQTTLSMQQDGEIRRVN